jgi:hypothetical protein
MSGKIWRSVSTTVLAYSLRPTRASYITRKNMQCAKEVRQMKRITGITGLAAVVMATLLMAGPGLAADNAREPMSVEKPGKLAMPHRVTGNVVSVDEAAGTFTVQDSKGKDYVLTADPALGSQLSDVKAGGHVKVSYKKAPSGQLIATKIAPADARPMR